MPASKIVSTVLWRRLDAPGHDACRLEERDSGWILAGTAVFAENGVASELRYRVRGDARWQTSAGEVRGWVGGDDVAFVIERTPSGASRCRRGRAPMSPFRVCGPARGGGGRLHPALSALVGGRRGRRAHGRVGWFVVGAGCNGAEYSALILVCLPAVALTDGESLKPAVVR